jgi:methylated-DNA-[protein]-cysteine S-methyltransferase
MGQSAMAVGECLELSTLWTFRTALGWFGVAGKGPVLEWLTFGHSTRNAALQAAEFRLSEDSEMGDWNPGLRKRIERFCETGVGDFADVETIETESTKFASRVIGVVRKIRPGATLSYGEVAAKAGSPGAARAVGNIMARNPIPIIIPCHRVTASGGALGGYSSPQGLSMKQSLLTLEAQAQRR